MRRFLKVLPFCLSLSLGACDLIGTADPFAEYDFMGDAQLPARLGAYFDYKSQVDQIPQQAPRAFIDFSNGLYQAYQGGSNNARMVELITQRLTSGDLKWYGLGNDQIYPLDLPSTQIYNRVADPASYVSEIMAPIEKTLQQITEGHGDALLVTDFEEYTPDKKEQFENYAKNYFTKWVKQGNSIDFFIADYTENTMDGRQVLKHLYFVVFSHGKERKMLRDIHYALDNRGVQFQTFNISTDFYRMANDYGANKKGGVPYPGGENIFSLTEESYVNGLAHLQPAKPYEFYPFGLSWEYLYQTTKATPGVGDVFRKLYMDQANQDVFSISELGIKTYDVTDDYLAFCQWDEAKKHKPVLVDDGNGNKVIDPETADPVIVSCYTPEGKLSLEYNPADSPEIKEVFALNKSLYSNSLRVDKAKVEIGTQWHQNFDYAALDKSGGLIRMDILIDACKPNFDPAKEALFKWESTTVAGKMNESLSEAIRNTLSEVNPQGKVVYSYFIKATPNH